MPVTKDDIDAVAINLLIDGNHTFQIYLTRGGLTKRLGSSDRADPSAILVQGRTDYYEPFMAAVPEALLQRESAEMEDGGRDGPRHDWRFEFQGGMTSLVYDIAYHAGSAGLPDEFADMVVQAERLTHSWYLTGVAEETGVPVPAPASRSVAPPAPKSTAKAPAARRGTASKVPSTPRSGPASARRPKSGALVPASRERIALAILLDFFALSIPYAYVVGLFSDGVQGGPPGAGLVLFAIAEFVLLVMLRNSPGYWLLGLSAPAQVKPLVDSSWKLRESKVTIAVGVLLCWSGASGMTAWTIDHAAVPYFGLELGRSMSMLVTVVLAIGSIAGGTLVLRTQMTGVWVGGGVMVVTLLAVLLGWSEWDGWVVAELEARAAAGARSLGAEGVASAQAFVRGALVAIPVLLLTGLGLSWKRFAGPVASVAPVPQTTR